MKRLPIFAVGATVLSLLAAPGSAWAQASTEERKEQSRALAKRIDKIIDARLNETKIKPAPRADAAALTRRLHIDLTGKIPTLLQLTDLMKATNDFAAKFEDRIDELLESEDYATNFANYWSSVIWRSLPTDGVNGDLSATFGPLLAKSVRPWFSANTTFDKIARQMIGSPVKGGFSFTAPDLFFSLNENKAERLAGETARIFLGVRIDCAECHNHPTADWKRKQFWEFAAFFSKKSNDKKNSDDGKRIQIPASDEFVTAKFLTGEEPDWEGSKSARETLADWIASAKNPYFAKAAVDHVWRYFFGVSLIEPIMEKTEGSQTHPVLLDELAKSFSGSNFDLKTLVRAILLTDAYQRSSVIPSEANKLDIEMFAKMPARALTADQLFDSLAVASNYVYKTPPMKKNEMPPPDPIRVKFLAVMNAQESKTETHTSILQALFLMNGTFVSERSQHVAQTVMMQDTPMRERVEALYLLVLSRLPRQAEMDRMVKFIERSGEPQQALMDVCWVLFNSSDFMLNH